MTSWPSRGFIDETTKGWRLEPGETLAQPEVAARGWNALRGDLELPVMLLHEEAMASNLSTMSDYCRHHGVDLAPHAKTSMSPEITQRQLQAGAWAMTAATPGQVRTLHAFGVRRIVMANELVDQAAIRWVADHLLSRGDTEFLCYVDSDEGIELLEKSLVRSPPDRPLAVLVEVGFRGGRTGVRSVTDAVNLAETIRRSPWLELAGVSGFEGLVPGWNAASGVPAGLIGLLEDIREVAEILRRQHLVDDSRRLVVSAGGSAYFDHVVDLLAPGRFDFPVRTVLRSGCYVTHDHGLYHETSPLAGSGRTSPSRRLRPAFELLASVWSRPEPGLVVVGFGRRDVPTDDRMPVVLRSHSKPSRSGEISAYRVVAINDQHAMVKVPHDSDVSVGDVLGFGISHPCGAFDRWRVIPIVAENYDVVSSVSTFF